MRILRTLNLRPHLFPLIFSIVIGIVIMFIRYWTLPHSFLYLFMHLLVAALSCIAALISSDVDLFPDLILSIIIVIIAVSFIVSCEKSLSHFFQSKRKNGLFILPLWINIITIFLVIYGNYFIIFPDFYLHFKPMQEVVEMVQSGQLIISSTDKIDYDQTDYYTTYPVNLPIKYKNLYIAGIRGEITREIYVVRGLNNQINLIAFIRSEGTDIHGYRYTAFMYKPTGQSISDEEIWGVAQCSPLLSITEVKKIITPSLNLDQDNWFWVDVYVD